MKVGCSFTSGDISSIGLNQLVREPELLKNPMERYCSATKRLIRDVAKLAIEAGLNEPGNLKRMRITVEIGDIADFKE